MKANRIISRLGVVIFFMTLVACSLFDESQEKVVEVFSSEKPYTLEILKERSYYQADKVVSRLSSKNVDSYILKSEDEDGDSWYSVVSGAFENDSCLEAFRLYLDTALQIKAGDVFLYSEMDSLDRIPVKEEAVKEQKRIDANKPDVPKDIALLISQYPKTDIFYLKNVSLLSLTDEGIESAEGRHVDMPRGVTLKKLKELGCVSFASVIYKDNLYKDEVTLQVAKLKDRPVVNQASVVPLFNLNNEEAAEICSLLADLVLATGKYKEEKKEEFQHPTQKSIVGYKVSFVTKEGNLRKYYFLTSETGGFVYMLQSTKEDDTELMDFLANIGKSDGGLEEFDEFYNSFYTVADKMANLDVLIGYYSDRLDYRYAKERGYAKWANRMVGHWFTNFCFYNDVKGSWEYSIFDLLTKNKSHQVYRKFYRSEQSKESERKIYGTVGTALYGVTINRYWELIKYLEEVSFSYDRYIVACSGDYEFSEEELIERVEKLQFEKGGYDKTAGQAEAASAQDSTTQKSE